MIQLVFFELFKIRIAKLSLISSQNKIPCSQKYKSYNGYLFTIAIGEEEFLQSYGLSFWYGVKAIDIKRSGAMWAFLMRSPREYMQHWWHPMLDERPVQQSMDSIYIFTLYKNNF